MNYKMVIDIDSFLEDYKQEKKTGTNERKKVNLDFQKDIEEKLDKIEKNAGNEDFKNLYKIYEELKNFDGDLPQKLLGIKKSSGTALKSVGERYSNEFLKNVKVNMSNLNNSIRNRIFEIDKQIDENNLPLAISLYNEATKEYRIFPKEFTIEKIELGEELRNREIEINQKLESTKDVEIKKIRDILKNEIGDLRVAISNKNVSKVENQIDNINYLMDKAPKIFFAHLIAERIAVAKTMIFAGKFLIAEYRIIFEEKKDIIYQLFDEFHKYYVEKDVNNALSTYDEIVLAFESVPEIFIEEKIEIYKQISSTFNSINNLLMTSNVNLFLESYNDSKVINEARDYVEHIKKTKKYNINVVNNLIEKISKVSIKLRPQTMELNKELKEILRHHNEKLNLGNSKIKNQNLDQPIVENKSKVMNNDVENDTPKKSLNLNKPLVENESRIAKDEVARNIMAEINSYYEKLKISRDKKEILTLFKKINFYLEMLHISDFEKKQIMGKVNEIVKSKIK